MPAYNTSTAREGYQYGNKRFLPKPDTKAYSIMARMAERPGVSRADMGEIYGSRSKNTASKCIESLRDVYSFEIKNIDGKYVIVGWLNNRGDIVPIESFADLIRVVR